MKHIKKFADGLERQVNATWNFFIVIVPIGNQHRCSYLLGCRCSMNPLDLLTQLKLAVSNAKHCEATPECRHLVVTYELERMEVLIDELLKLRKGE